MLKLHCLLALSVQQCEVLSQVYGDPLEHPQTETYWGNVNCIGERSCYDEGKRAAECLTFDYQREHNTDVRQPMCAAPMCHAMTTAEPALPSYICTSDNC